MLHRAVTGHEANRYQFRSATSRRRKQRIVAQRLVMYELPYAQSGVKAPSERHEVAYGQMMCVPRNQTDPDDQSRKTCAAITGEAEIAANAST